VDTCGSGRGLRGNSNRDGSQSTSSETELMSYGFSIQPSILTNKHYQLLKVKVLLNQNRNFHLNSSIFSPPTNDMFN